MLSMIKERTIQTLITEQMSDKDQAKLQYGVALFYDTLTKGIVVYGLAILLGIGIETLTAHCSFYLFRQVTYGWHYPSSLGCTLVSVTIFVLIPFSLPLTQLNEYILIPLGLVAVSIIGVLGPVDTKQYRLTSEHKAKLHQSALVRIVIIILVYVVTPPQYHSYVLLGVSFQAFTLVFQLLKNRRCDSC